MKPDLPGSVRAPWRAFLETCEPLRPDLFRYCRHLTHSAWDAEDLAQDTLARAFVALAQVHEPPPNPRAWLFRVASNLWTDRMRRRREPAPAAEPATGDDPRATREAAGTLVGRLSPQERAAVVLKDVFELTLEEVAEALSTTAGAVKAALHRARGKLGEPPAEPAAPPPPAVLDAFCAAFRARDLDGLTGLLLDTAAVEVVGATVEYGPERARQTVLWGMLFGVERMASSEGPLDPRFTHGLLPDRPPRVEPRAHRGEWLLLHWYAHEGGDAVRALTRLEVDGDRIARVRNYFYNPELVAEVCAELGLPARSNGRRWWR